MNISATIKLTTSANQLTISKHLSAAINTLPDTLPDSNDPNQPPVNITLNISAISAPDNRLPISTEDLPTKKTAASLPIPKEQRYPKTPAARELRQLIESAGWIALRSAFPTFCAVDPHSARICLIVAKSSRGRRLKSAQHALLARFSAYNIPVYRFSPKTGLERLFCSLPPVSPETEPSESPSAHASDSTRTQVPPENVLSKNTTNGDIGVLCVSGNVSLPVEEFIP